MAQRLKAAMARKRGGEWVWGDEELNHNFVFVIGNINNYFYV